MAASRVSLSSVDLLCVGCGPGSYTGVRVAIALAKGLAFGRTIPSLAFSSLTAYAPAEEGRFASVFDARAGGLYVQYGEVKEGEVSFDKEPKQLSLELFASELCDLQWLMTADGESLRSRLKAELPHISLTLQEVRPSPLLVAKLAIRRLLEGGHSNELAPLYLRGAVRSPG